MQNFSIEVEGYTITDSLLYGLLNDYFRKMTMEYNTPKVYITENQIKDDEEIPREE